MVGHVRRAVDCILSTADGAIHDSGSGSQVQRKRGQEERESKKRAYQIRRTRRDMRSGKRTAVAGDSGGKIRDEENKRDHCANGTSDRRDSKRKLASSSLAQICLLGDRPASQTTFFLLGTTERLRCKPVPSVSEP